jgi:CubicO group peptidase (beta-lactamase class C family)
MQAGVADGVFPGAVILVAREGRIVFFRSFGYRRLLPEPQAMEEDTIFDLASLTKPLATTLAVMGLVDQGTVQLDQPVGDIVSVPLKDKSPLTLRSLLSHSAGFAEWKPFYRDLMDYNPEDRKAKVREWLVEEPFAYPPGSASLYSDLGFMFIEWVVEEASGVPMHRLLERGLFGPVGVERTFMGHSSSLERFQQEQFAATEDCPWRKEVIQGKVHDENAFAMGGYSGHAGLFGTGAEVHKIVEMLREHEGGNRRDLFRPEVVKEFFSGQHTTPESTWALGWDTPSRENSSSGSHFSQRSVGHLGFTGTSVWLDLDRGVAVILLTNRIHPTRENERIKLFRPQLHDAVMEELGYS